MPATEWLGRSISDEFEGSQLGDKRRSDRLGWLAEKLMAAPGVGFPQAVDTPSELGGVYRFLGNEQFDAEQILDPHLSATVERVSSAGLCIVAHDTTEVSLGGASRRAGLGVTSGGSQGFLAHVALAVLPGEERVPLGVLGLQRHVRLVHKGGRGRRRSVSRRDPERESLRWPAMLEAVHARCPGSALIHVMDREADIFEVLAKAQELGARYVAPPGRVSRAAYTNRAIAKLAASGERMSGKYVRRSAAITGSQPLATTPAPTRTTVSAIIR